MNFFYIICFTAKFYIFIQFLWIKYVFTIKPYLILLSIALGISGFRTFQKQKALFLLLQGFQYNILIAYRWIQMDKKLYYTQKKCDIRDFLLFPD